MKTIQFNQPSWSGKKKNGNINCCPGVIFSTLSFQNVHRKKIHSGSANLFVGVSESSIQHLAPVALVHYSKEERLCFLDDLSALRLFSC